MKRIGSYKVKENTITVNVYTDLSSDTEGIDETKIMSNLISIGDNILCKVNDDIMITVDDFFLVVTIEKEDNNILNAIVIAADTVKNIISADDFDDSPLTENEKKAIEEAEREIKEGNTVSFDEVCKQLNRF